jgi:hypothetical protein
VALQDFKITYRDGATQAVKASSHRTDGDWIVFYSGADQVLRVPGGDVQSISRADVPDRETPLPMIG